MVHDSDLEGPAQVAILSDAIAFFFRGIAQWSRQRRFFEVGGLRSNLTDLGVIPSMGQW